MAFKRLPNNQYYYFNRSGNTEVLVKNNSSTRDNGVLSLSSKALVPKELIGKRVRVRLEIIDEEGDENHE